MDKAKLIHRLRITTTAVCLLLFATLCMLWARSLTVHDTALWQPTSGRNFYVHSALGRVIIGSSLSTNKEPQPFVVFSQSVDPIVRDDFFEGGQFKFVTNQLDSAVYLPHWFVLCVVVVLAAVPWIRWQFSLQTLLIVTTLVAVVLGGLVMW